MKLVYARSHDGNFGDDLNTVLWPYFFSNLEAAGNAKTGLVGVGTIIGMPVPGLDDLHVLSSGVGYDDVADWSGKTVHYWSVRGRLTAERLGLPVEKAIGDGAYLMPLIVEKPVGPTTRRPIVIPHLDSVRIGGWERAARLADFELVDPRGDPLEVIAKIAAAPLVLTESLHGAILADAFGVGWTPFATSRNFSAFKWADWMSTFGQRVPIETIPPPRPEMWATYGRRSHGLDAEIDAYLSGEIDFGGNGKCVDSALKRRLKVWAAMAPGVGLVLGAHPARTAEALKRLVIRDPIVAEPTRIDSIQARLLDVIRVFGRETGAELSGEFS